MVKAILVGTIVAVFCAVALPVCARPMQSVEPLPVRARPMGPAQQAAKPRISLADFLDKLAWDPVASGPLLIVSPESTFVPGPQDVNTQPEDAEDPRPQALSLNASGNYKAGIVAAYFDRRIVPVNSISVFAPRTMTVLNYKNLPAPDAYTGMSLPTKLRLLESTFTDAQWAESSSDAGIGAEDMTGTQRDIYLSMLPDPLYVAPTNASTAAGSASTALTADQRLATRLQMQKRLTVGFLQGDQYMQPSTRENKPVEFGYTLRMASPMSYLDGADTLGIELRRVVPNKQKPTELPGDWPALDRLIDPVSAKTVGDLVGQIARQTGAHLYCDPRYAVRSIYFRGGPVRAGDLLAGLCWTLTATWRRLNDSFVLTDDIVGLGVRHARIQEWIQKKELLATLRDAQIAQVLKAKEYKSLAWSSSDPFEPGPQLVGKLDEFFARPSVPLPANGDVRQFSVVPVADLPEAARLSFQTEYEQRFKGLPLVRTSGGNAVVGAQTQASYIVPGMGRLAVSELPRFFPNQDLLTKPYLPRISPHAADENKIADLFRKNANRALLADPPDVPAVATLAKEARQRGFTELWVTVPPGDTARVEAAVQAGKENGVAIYAVLRMMRPEPDTPAEGLALNILGETTTQYVRRRLRDAHEILARVRLPEPRYDGSDSYSLPNWASESVADVELRRGDFRQDTKAERLKFTTFLSHVSAMPDLAGVVLEESAPPGFGPLVHDGEGYSRTDAALEMGYDPTTRLACLTGPGFDPIDVSPIGKGDEGLDIPLPFFRAYAHKYAYQEKYERYIRPAEGDSLWTLWSSFCHDLAVTTIHAAVEAASTARPGFRVLKPNRDISQPFRVNWYAPIDSFDLFESHVAGAVPEKSATSAAGNRLVAKSKYGVADPKISYVPIVLGGG